MTTQLRDRILAAILCRRYRNPITAQVLVDQFPDLHSIREVTEIVAEARDAGYKIASSKGGWDRYLNENVEAGYFQAVRPEEIRSTADMLESTIAHLSSRRKKLLTFGGDPTLYEQG